MASKRNYCVTHKELAAVMKSLGHFHHFLYGTKFMIQTNHAALHWLKIEGARGAAGNVAGKTGAVQLPDSASGREGTQQC